LKVKKSVDIGKEEDGKEDQLDEKRVVMLTA